MSARGQMRDRPAAPPRALGWYWNRLRRMGLGEMAFRMRRSVSAPLTRPLAATPAARFDLAPPVPWLGGARDAPAASAALLAHAQRTLDGQWVRLDGQVVELPAQAAWSLPGAGADDIRHAMELHRHAHLVPLAQAFRATGDARYREALLLRLEQWIDAFPPGSHPAWTSALDVALRLVNWSIAWQLMGLDPVADSGATANWVGSVHAHARHVRHALSRHSSANNHLLGELVGLCAAGATWPYWTDLDLWARQAGDELAVECLRQTHDDGVGCEQASWYQAFAFELMAIHLLILRARAEPVPPALTQRLASMARFGAALRNVAGRVSHHGDADGATACGLWSSLDEPIDRMIEAAAALRLAPELAALPPPGDGVGAWLCGAPSGTLSRPAVLLPARARQSLPRGFAAGGYYQLGAHFGTAREVLMTVDAGPLGYLSIAAHGHADALSVRLSAAGRDLLVDRGTGCYNTEPPWRHYFRGTSAHNTACIDGEDQSAYGGPFLWLTHARCRVSRFDSSDASGLLVASHDGYRRLAGGPVHERSVRWDGDRRRFTVRDVVSGKGRREVVVAWHLAPGLQARAEGDRVLVHDDGRPVMTMHANGQSGGGWSLHHGGASEFAGWHSARFGQREPAATLLWRTAADGPTWIETRLQLHDDEGST